MANPNTATRNAPSAAVDEALRITSQTAHRTTENAQAIVDLGRRYLDQTSHVNRDLLELWTASVEAGFQTAFDLQNAALANSQSLLETSFGLSKDALTRGAELTRQAQATTLKTFQSNARLAKTFMTDAAV